MLFHNFFNATLKKSVLLVLILVFLLTTYSPAQTIKHDVVIANHKAIYDNNGMLLPWISLRSAVDLEMQWYLHCPVTHGYPNFVWMTFMDGNYQPDIKRNDFIPATQNG